LAVAGNVSESGKLTRDTCELIVIARTVLVKPMFCPLRPRVIV
jgi:hypothetical protein